MRFLFFIAVWVCMFAQGLTAQTLTANSQGDFLGEMTRYVESHLEVSFPEEKQKVKDLIKNYKTQGTLAFSYEDLLQQTRKSYWENVFLKENRDWAMKERLLNQRGGTVARSSTIPLANPDLEESCNLNIVFVIDQSASIISEPDEMENIRTALNDFLQDQVGTGNTISLIGMGSLTDDPTVGPNTEAIGPITTTYDAGVTTNTHNDWINNTLFEFSSGNSDSWSTGLNLATAIPADLVFIIADGGTGEADDINGICAAGNLLKANGANGGNGAHLFVFTENPGGFINTSLMAYLQGGISNPPIEAFTPSTEAMSTRDYASMLESDDFASLHHWLETIVSQEAQIVTNSIWPRNCILNNFTIRGDAFICEGLTIDLIQLQFIHNGVVQATAPATLNPDGTWEFASSLGTMVDLGLEHGTWYDVIPLMIFSDGTIVAGEEFALGANNDLYLAPQSDPVVTVNSLPTTDSPSKTRFCEGDFIFYHGSDPLSANHFSAIRRRPIGSPQPFGDYQTVEWLNASLDDFHGDLDAQYPGYLEAGWEYQLYIASSNAAECIAWSPVEVVFEIIDCCMPSATLETPDCVTNGVPFKVSVTLDAPLLSHQIQNVSSTDPNYTYLNHTILELDGAIQLIIGFMSNSCTCEGEPVAFNIAIKGCDKIPLDLVTDPLPCCTTTCEDIAVVQETIYPCSNINGQIARGFCLTLSSPTPLLGVSSGSGVGTCPTSLAQLTITENGTNGTYEVCGYVVFDDDECIDSALASFILDNSNGCCTFEHPFSFADDCFIREKCSEVPANIEYIYGTTLQISLDLPVGQIVTIYDFENGGFTTATVGTITCNPSGIDQNGDIIGGNDCTGITLAGPASIDCSSSPATPYPYHYGLINGTCSWVIFGDLCDELILPLSTPDGGGGDSGGQGSRTEGRIAQDDEVKAKVFPNPLSNSEVLYFDWTGLQAGVKAIQISDVRGSLMERILPPTTQQTFEYRLEKPLPSGLYFVVFYLDDGTVSSTRLVARE